MQWRHHNEVIWKPGAVDENGLPKKREVFHCRENIKYSPDKMFHVCYMVMHLPVDEAIKHLEFIPRKGCGILKEVLLEAQEMAVRDYNVEFKSNLWLAEAFAKKSRVIKGVRRHMGGRYGLVQYKYCNLYVRLEEGAPPPPENRLWFPKKDGWQKADQYINWLRSRRIELGL